MNIAKDKKHISIDKAIELINRRTYSLLFSSNSKAQGARIFFPMDTAIVEYDTHLKLGRYNCCDTIRIPLTEIIDVVYSTDKNENDSVCFSLANGEEWRVSLCGEEENYQSQINTYEEIEIDEFLKKLRACSEVFVSHAQEHLSLNAYYDTVNIVYTNDDLDYDDEREIQITLSDSNRHFTNCTLCFDEYGYNAKFHLVSKSNSLEIFHISLLDMPLLSKLVLSLAYCED